MTHPALFFPLQSQLSYLGPCFLRSQLMRLILLPTAVSLNLSPGDLGSKISGGLWYLSYHQRFQTQEPWFSMVLFNSFRDTFGQGIFYWSPRKNLSVVDTAQRRRSHSLAAILCRMPVPETASTTLHREHATGGFICCICFRVTGRQSQQECFYAAHVYRGLKTSEVRSGPISLISCRLFVSL